jgi:preprotein translocase subunit YajC
MTENLVPILLITLTIVLIVILFIVVSYIFMRLKSLEQRQAESAMASPQEGKKGGSLSGFRGKGDLGCSRESR